LVLVGDAALASASGEAHAATTAAFFYFHGYRHQLLPKEPDHEADCHYDYYAYFTFTAAIIHCCPERQERLIAAGAFCRCFHRYRQLMPDGQGLLGCHYDSLCFCFHRYYHPSVDWSGR
jgi:hypothetical protein